MRKHDEYGQGVIQMEDIGSSSATKRMKTKRKMSENGILKRVRFSPERGNRKPGYKKRGSSLSKSMVPKEFTKKK